MPKICQNNAKSGTYLCRLRSGRGRQLERWLAANGRRCGRGRGRRKAAAQVAASHAGGRQ